MRLSTFLSARHYQLLVVGGGAGGLGASHKFARKLPKNSVAVVEPNEKHYYQPGFTLVGGGIMTLKQNVKKEADLMHSNCTWIKDRVEKFEADRNTVVLGNGEHVTYDYLIVAAGLQLRYDLIKGCPEALDTPGVCSNYSPLYVEKTYQTAMNFKSGNAIFTFPNTPIKCPGALQKACYITEEILQKRGVRKDAKVIYATSLGKLFGIDSYLKSLNAVAKEKQIDVKTRRNLIEVDTKRKVAIFEKLDENAKPTGETEQFEYSMLHIGPPCSTPKAVRESNLVDKTGFVDVDPDTLQSKKYPNVFAIGDCANTPNAKTAAAVSSQLKALENNLWAVMRGQKPGSQYDGYASCPLVIGGSKCILAEFNSKGPMETTFLDQSKPTRWAYYLKRYAMPFLYWKLLIKGYWNGPALVRKILHLGLKK